MTLDYAMSSLQRPSSGILEPSKFQTETKLNKLEPIIDLNTADARNKAVQDLKLRLERMKASMNAA